MSGRTIAVLGSRQARVKNDPVKRQTLDTIAPFECSQSKFYTGDIPSREQGWMMGQNMASGRLTRVNARTPRNPMSKRVAVVSLRVGKAQDPMDVPEGTEAGLSRDHPPRDRRVLLVGYRNILQVFVMLRSGRSNGEGRVKEGMVCCGERDGVEVKR